MGTIDLDGGMVYYTDGGDTTAIHVDTGTIFFIQGDCSTTITFNAPDPGPVVIDSREFNWTRYAEPAARA